jgi:hypothetical protein
MLSGMPATVACRIGSNACIDQDGTISPAIGALTPPIAPGFAPNA